MATFLELRNLYRDSDLMEKVEVAVIIAANNMISGTPTDAQKKWAAGVFSNPAGEAKKALMSVIAENAGLTVAQIQGATDAAIQNNVDAVAGVLADAFSL